MRERPILFSGAMVRAIIDGRKTQTRRVIKAKRGWPIDFVGGGPVGGPDWNDPNCWGFEDPNTTIWWLLNSDGDGSQQIPSPYGQPGDRLWVREAWRVGRPHDKTPPREILPNALEKDKGVTVLYEAGGWRSVGPAGREEPVYAADAPMPDWAGKRRPPMFMPRWACRLELEITGVRVERLNDCSAKDAIAEGAEPLPPCQLISQICPEDYVAGYRKLWDGINGTGAWDANPWVWVVEFRRI